MSLLARVKNWISGEVLTAADLNAEFNNVVNNFKPSKMDDISSDTAAMQILRDVFPSGSESLAIDLAEELQGIRYVIQQLINNSDATPAGDWYKFPDLTTKTAAFTAAITERVILCDGTGGAFTGTLPTAVGLKDKVFYIKKIDASANAITVDGDGSETIDGVTTKVLSNQYDFAVIVSNGTNWHIVGGLIPAPTITDFTNMNHDHGDADDGGEIVWQGLPDGAVVQAVNVQDGAVATGTTALPYDDSIPQNTEGDEYMTLAITPKATTNKLKIEVVAQLSHTADSLIVAALFQDSTANALAAGMGFAVATVPEGVKFTHYMAAGTTSATTFKIRAGTNGGATTTFNGGSGARKFGGVFASSITIIEIKA